MLSNLCGCLLPDLEISCGSEKCLVCVCVSKFGCLRVPRTSKDHADSKACSASFAPVFAWTSRPSYNRTSLQLHQQLHKQLHRQHKQCHAVRRDGLCNATGLVQLLLVVLEGTLICSLQWVGATRHVACGCREAARFHTRPGPELSASCPK